MKKVRIRYLGLALVLCCLSLRVFAAATEEAPPEKMDIESIKEKYWAKGSEAELRVVQNRTYTKAHRVELGVFGAAIATDPFLSVKAIGATAGYYFSEYFSLRAMYFKDFVSNSSALDTFQQTSHETTDTNEPHYFVGLEASLSPIYGKLSLFGSSIIYFDFRVSAGAGARNTDTGTYPAPMIGLGEEVFITKNFAITLDYRLIYYHEQIREEVIPSEIGQVIGSRNNFNDVFMAGASFLIP